MENEELKSMRTNAKMIVTGFAATATASCTIPIPVADSFILISEQITMMGAIGMVYKLNLKKNTLWTLVLGALGAGGTSMLGKTIVSSVFKFIPGIGSVIGSVISASTAGILTLALGNTFIELCEKIKSGEWSEGDISGKKGTEYFKTTFRKSFNALKKEKEKHPDSDYGTDCEFDENVSEKVDGEIDLSKVSFSNIEGIYKYDTICPNINYDGKLIGTVTFAMKNHHGNERKAVLCTAVISKDYRGKHIFSHTIKQISNFCPIEISVKKFPEYKDMTLHLLNYKNVIEGK